jgi:hypothetical protein
MLSQAFRKSKRIEAMSLNIAKFKNNHHSKTAGASIVECREISLSG